MRNLVPAISVIVGLAMAGQAGAASAPTDLVGAWREAAVGSCDTPYLQAVERTTGPKGEAAVVGVVRAGGKEVRGVIPLAGSRKGRLIDAQTGKPVLQLIPLRGGRLKVSVASKDAGLTTTTLEFCENSRPDYAAGDAARAALPGAWYEISQTGLKLVTKKDVKGLAGCSAAPTDSGQRGDLTITQEGGALRWSLRGIDSYSDWAPSEATPVVFLGKTWLRTNLGAQGATRFASFGPAPGSGDQRLIVADPGTQSFRYYNRCPA